MELIGFIGLGNMGRPMASNLCRKGAQVIVHDIASDAVARLTKLGARGAASVAEVARQATIVFTMLPDSAAVDAVVAGPDGVLAHLPRGGVLVDMSTVDPHLTDRLGKAAAEKGIA